MKLKLFNAAVAGLVMSVSCLVNMANASLITLTDTQFQTTNGQDFFFNFSPVSPSDGGSGLLDILIRGDFTIGATLNESFDFDIESSISGTGLQATAGNLITSFGYNDNLFRITQVIFASNLNSILSDSSISLNVNYASGVDQILTTTFITATIQYNDTATSVPEPVNLAFLGLGIVAFGVSRRKKNAWIA